MNASSTARRFFVLTALPASFFSRAFTRNQIDRLNTTGLPPIVCFVIHAASAESR